MFVFFSVFYHLMKKAASLVQQCIESYLLLVFCDRFT